MHINMDKMYVRVVKRHFRIFATELWPLFDDSNWFLLNILRKDGQHLTKFCLLIILDQNFTK